MSGGREVTVWGSGKMTVKEKASSEGKPGTEALVGE